MTAFAAATNWRRHLRVPEIAPRQVVPWLLMLVLLLKAPDVWYLSTPLVAVFALGMAFHRWVYTSAFWYIVATLLGAAVYVNWATADNHKYLFVYGALALCCVFSLPRQEQDKALAQTSRWLIGLCMLLATAWKLVDPQYLSGGFFQYELLADHRFAAVAQYFGALSPAELAGNVELRELVVNGHLRGFDVREVELTTTPHVTLLAWLFTWWTITIEGLLALLFLVPDRPGVARARNVALLVFGLSTYLIAPVRGFGWMLMLLGFAQCEERDRMFRPAYLAVFVLIQLYLTPVAAIVELVQRG